MSQQPPVPEITEDTIQQLVTMVRTAETMARTFEMDVSRAFEMMLRSAQQLQREQKHAAQLPRSVPPGVH